MIETKDEQAIAEKPSNDVISTATGSVYDKGESIVSKMNKQQAYFDRDLFFQELYENYLVSVQRGEERIKPGSGIILRWDEFTSFDDFLSDAIDNIDRQLNSIKMAREAHVQKFSILDDSLLAEAKIDEGSAVTGQQFSAEDYDAVYEILMLSRETIIKLRTGKLNMIVNTQTGRVRVTGTK